MKQLAPLTAIALLVAAVLSSTGTYAAQLVMFNASECEWCERWDEEVGVIFSKTDEGKRLPLRRVDIHDDRPADIKWIDRVVYTPTFILIEKGREVGRINGYPGEDHFWGLLGVLIKKWRKKGGARWIKCHTAC